MRCNMVQCVATWCAAKQHLIREPNHMCCTAVPGASGASWVASRARAPRCEAPPIRMRIAGAAVSPAHRRAPVRAKARAHCCQVDEVSTASSSKQKPSLSPCPCVSACHGMRLHPNDARAAISAPLRSSIHTYCWPGNSTDFAVSLFGIASEHHSSQRCSALLYSLSAYLPHCPCVV